MKHRIIVQKVISVAFIPKTVLLQQWAMLALQTQTARCVVTIRIVDEAEMIELNETFRHKSGPTNVLSFPCDVPREFANDELGDIVICASVVKQEALAQQKSNEAHWAHMIIHGVYHLLGFDHITDSDAKEMETLEIKTLKTLGFANPYDMETK